LKILNISILLGEILNLFGINFIPGGVFFYFKSRGIRVYKLLLKIWGKKILGA